MVMRTFSDRLRRGMPAGLVVLLVVQAGSLGGCASQGALDDSRSTIRGLTQRNAELEQQVAAMEAEVTEAEREAEAARARAAAAAGRAGDTQRSRESEIQALLEENERLMTLVDQMGLGALPTNIDVALEDLARRYPDLVVYDRGRGMIRLESDLTFEMGSAEVQSGVEPALRRVAEVIAPEDDFALEVVGHTDDVPVSRPATRQRRGWGSPGWRVGSAPRLPVPLWWKSWAPRSCPPAVFDQSLYSS